MSTSHMSGSEHFRAAEELLTEALERKNAPRTIWGSEWFTNTLAAAQVHATLALTAATVHASLPGYQTVNIVETVANQWDPILTPGTAGEQR